MAGNIVPRTDGGSNLGTADKEFNVIYAKSFGGTIASQVVTTNSPTFTGTPAAPTAAAGTNTTQIATTAFANAAASAAASSAVSTHNLASDAHSATIAAAVNTHNAATDAHSTEFAKYLPLSGGAMSGSTIRRDTDDSLLYISGASLVDANHGAFLELNGGQNTARQGNFRLIAGNSTAYKVLDGKPDGTLTWAGKEIKSMAFPSNTIVNIPTTNTSYTAPANGFLLVSVKANADYAVLDLHNGYYIDVINCCTKNGANFSGLIPLAKGMTGQWGIIGATIKVIGFTYAQGEV